MNHFSQNIKFLRNEKQITATEFRELCKLSVSTMMIENGSINPAPDELLRIAEALKYPVERLVREDIAGTYQKIKGFKMDLLALDVDGVLTDGGMYFTQNGDEFKKFNTKDGLAIIRMTQAGINVAFISSGINDNIIKKRADFLGVQRVYVGTWKKLEVLEGWCNELNTTLDHVAYIGDDLNDLVAIKKVGLSACPSDAVSKIKQSVHIVLEKRGGKGAVREFAERFVMDIGG
jgi:YrbI family 3-deoxy-D-manno-octulosonate 8-phosphate phosphatase